LVTNEGAGVEGRGKAAIKLQGPTSKLQRSTKLQIPKKAATNWSLGFGISLELGA
jgi:hypothetical protein